MKTIELLNENEALIYNECKKLSDERGDTGAEFTFFDLCQSLKNIFTQNQLKGYISILIEKNLLETIGSEYYFDYYVKELM
jgi:hypothetical protein